MGKNKNVPENEPENTTAGSEVSTMAWYGHSKGVEVFTVVETYERGNKNFLSVSMSLFKSCQGKIKRAPSGASAYQITFNAQNCQQDSAFPMLALLCSLH